jgi:hypothetical protein
MMTLKRFRTLADIYGADLQRWPERVRPHARTLLETSAEARNIIGRAEELDEAITAASNEHRQRLWSGDHPEAALVRLRNSVAARIRPVTPPRFSAAGAPTLRPARNPGRRAGWIGLATAASVAIVSGLALGIRYSQAAPQQDLLALLQPAPVQLLND